MEAKTGNNVVSSLNVKSVLSDKKLKELDDEKDWLSQNNLPNHKARYLNSNGLSYKNLPQLDGFRTAIIEATEMIKLWMIAEYWKIY